jgi:hypothetical protein
MKPPPDRRRGLTRPTRPVSDGFKDGFSGGKPVKRDTYADRTG